MDKEGFLSEEASAQCGLFGVMEDHAQSVQSLDDHFVRKPKSTFFLRASGDSMWPVIYAQDILIVERSMQPLSGQIVIAAYEGELICKRLSLGPAAPQLVSDNPKFSPIHFDSQEELVIWGVVSGIARSLRS